MNFPFLQSLCFYNFFFLLTILKGLKPFKYKGKHETESKNFFFFWFFNGYCVICDNFGDIRDAFKQDLALEFRNNKKKL